MSSLTKTKFPSSVYLADNDEPEPKEEKPVEKPDEGATAKWKAGGYIPTRASWHSVRGRIQRFLA